MCPYHVFVLFQLADETEKSKVLSFPLNSLPLQKEIIVEEVSAVNLQNTYFQNVLNIVLPEIKLQTEQKSLHKIVHLFIDNVKKNYDRHIHF